MVAACARAGAVDGITRLHEPTVDGLPLEAHVGMLELLRVAARSPRSARSSRRTPSVRTGRAPATATSATTARAAMTATPFTIGGRAR